MNPFCVAALWYVLEEIETSLKLYFYGFGDFRPSSPFAKSDIIWKSCVPFCWLHILKYLMKTHKFLFLSDLNILEEKNLIFMKKKFSTSKTSKNFFLNFLTSKKKNYFWQIFAKSAFFNLSRTSYPKIVIKISFKVSENLPRH